jgi:hypothetical protein
MKFINAVNSEESQELEVPQTCFWNHIKTSLYQTTKKFASQKIEICIT